MKLVVLLSLVLSFQAFASNVVVTPSKPVNCSQQNAHHVNWINNVQTTEDANKLTVTFNTNYGSCINGEISYYNLMNDSSLTFWHQGINWPWSYSPYSFLRLDNATDGNVTIEFNKNIIFNKSSIRNYDMQFSAKKNSFRQANFMWNIKLVKVSAEKTILSVK